MRKLLLLLALVAFKSNAQDVSGAVGGAVSATMASSMSDDQKRQNEAKTKPKTKVYAISEEVKIEGTFVVYREKDYQVYKAPDGRMYFKYNQKRIYFKSVL